MGLSAKGSGEVLIRGNQWASGRKNEKIVDLFYKNSSYFKRICRGVFRGVIKVKTKKNNYITIKQKNKQLHNNKAMKKTKTCMFR